MIKQLLIFMIINLSVAPSKASRTDRPSNSESDKPVSWVIVFNSEQNTPICAMNVVGQPEFVPNFFTTAPTDYESQWQVELPDCDSTQKAFLSSQVLLAERNQTALMQFIPPAILCLAAAVVGSSAVINGHQFLGERLKTTGIAGAATAAAMYLNRTSGYLSKMVSPLNAATIVVGACMVSAVAITYVLVGG